ncbi:Reverse transcriptase [Phytophthora palmivora]|uniref:Reverse transcriptase n=1 Tax=Phytophthora palmivora TaxID=4796 RepID=A0A2P4XVJ1_9STRA|nr:Reverse transcriptase [Phytophthora palmivora]
MVPAQTPYPCKDVLLNNMSGCTLYSDLNLVDGYYQIPMRESDIPLTAVSTPSVASDATRAFECPSVVCEASDETIGCGLSQKDDEG